MAVAQTTDALAAARRALSAVRAAQDEVAARVEQAREQLAKAKAAVITRDEAVALAARLVDELAGPIDVGAVMGGDYLTSVRVRDGIANLRPAQLVATVLRGPLLQYITDRLDAEALRRGGWGTADELERAEAVEYAKASLAAAERQRDELAREAAALGGGSQPYRPAPDGVTVEVGEVPAPRPPERDSVGRIPRDYSHLFRPRSL